MQKTEHNQTASTTHRKVQVSTTLNRRYVRKPSYSKVVVKKNTKSPVMSDDSVRVSVSRSSKIQRFREEMSEASPQYMNAIQNNSLAEHNASSQQKTFTRVAIQDSSDWAKQQTPLRIQTERDMRAPEAHPLQVAASERMKRRSVPVAEATARSLTAKELKDQAIQKALAQASRPTEPITSGNSGKMAKMAKKKQNKKSGIKNMNKVKFGFGRVVLALSCTAAAVFAIVYFVNLNMPDLSLKVAAMQTGIQASYPNYIPRDYSLSEIASEEGKVVMNFRNSNDGGAYTIVEERSSWDSNALLTNYVSENYGEDYTVIREQGLTIYVDGSDATWVNGGVLFKLNTTSGSLSKKQITTIATSL